MGATATAGATSGSDGTVASTFGFGRRGCFDRRAQISFSSFSTWGGFRFAERRAWRGFALAFVNHRPMAEVQAGVVLVLAVRAIELLGCDGRQCGDRE